jgi:maltoporin
VTKPTERGEWSVFANRMQIHSKTFNTAQQLNVSSGYAAGFLYKDTRLMSELFGMEGESISALFYGEGVAKGAGSTSPYLQEGFIDAVLGTSDAVEAAETWRFVNHNVFENEQWGLISNFMYEKRFEVGFSGTDQTWISAGVRPYWFFHKNGRLVLEEGIDRIEDNAANKTYLLTKTTIALEAALDKGVWKRPVIRLFYTYADWSDNAVGMVSSYYPTQTHGDNVGIQLEYWW